MSCRLPRKRPPYVYWHFCFVHIWFEWLNFILPHATDYIAFVELSPKIASYSWNRIYLRVTRIQPKNCMLLKIRVFISIWCNRLHNYINLLIDWLAEYGRSKSEDIQCFNQNNNNSTWSINFSIFFIDLNMFWGHSKAFSHVHMPPIIAIQKGVYCILFFAITKLEYFKRTLYVCTCFCIFSVWRRKWLQTCSPEIIFYYLRSRNHYDHFSLFFLFSFKNPTPLFILYCSQQKLWINWRIFEKKWHPNVHCC